MPTDNTTDLYQTLGLTKDAIQEDIKQAYRRLAQRHHPDKNGGKESDEFLRIKAAYEVLSDPDRRADYDSTGNTKADRITIEARNRLTMLFKVAIEQMNPYTNVLAGIATQLKAAEVDIHTKLQSIETKAAQIQKKRGKVRRRTDGLDLWDRLIDQMEDNLQNQRHAFEHELKVIARLSDLLSEYDCDCPVPTSAPTGYTVRGITQQTGVPPTWG